MSAFLLDTDILIAIVNRSLVRLPKRIRALLEGSDFAPMASVVSPWKMAIKHSVGMLPFEQPVTKLASIFESYGCTVLPMTIEHALEVAQGEPTTKGPFGRLLLAVCVCEGLKQ